MENKPSKDYTRLQKIVWFVLFYGLYAFVLTFSFCFALWLYWMDYPGWPAILVAGIQTLVIHVGMTWWRDN